MSDGASTPGARATAFARSRLDRVRLDRVPVAVRPWIAVCWLLTFAVAVLLLVPGLADEVAVDPDSASRILDRFLAPAWLRMLLALAAGVVVACRVVLALLRQAADADASRMRREVALALSCFPALALAADRVAVPAVLAGATFLALELVAHLGRASRRRAAISGAVALLCWAVLAAAQLADVASTWTWVVLFGLAAGFAAFGSYYGIQRAAESRTGAVSFLFRTRMSRPAVLAVALLMAGLVLLRLTVLRELFAEPDPTLWSPFAKESPLSWLHAALVAGLIAAVGAASNRRPLARQGERRIAASLAVVGNAELVIGGFVVVGVFLVAVVLGDAVFPVAWIDAVPVLKFAGVLALGALALLPRFAGTSARVLAAVTAVYLLPPTGQGVLVLLGVDLPPGIAGFPATPAAGGLVGCGALAARARHPGGPAAVPAGPGCRPGAPGDRPVGGIRGATARDHRDGARDPEPLRRRAVRRAGAAVALGDGRDLARRRDAPRRRGGARPIASRHGIVPPSRCRHEPAAR